MAAPKEVEFSPSAAFEAEKLEFLTQLANFGIHLKKIDCVSDATSKSKKSWLCPGKLDRFYFFTLVKRYFLLPFPISEIIYGYPTLKLQIMI